MAGAGDGVGSSPESSSQPGPGIHPALAMILFEVSSQWLWQCPVPAVQCQQTQPDGQWRGPLSPTSLSSQGGFGLDWAVQGPCRGSCGHC